MNSAEIQSNKKNAEGAFCVFSGFLPLSFNFEPVHQVAFYKHSLNSYQ
jgi:hypothetical protein